MFISMTVILFHSVFIPSFPSLITSLKPSLRCFIPHSAVCGMTASSSSFGPTYLSLSDGKKEETIHLNLRTTNKTWSGHLTVLVMHTSAVPFHLAAVCLPISLSPSWGFLCWKVGWNVFVSEETTTAAAAHCHSSSEYCILTQRPQQCVCAWASPTACHPQSAGPASLSHLSTCTWSCCYLEVWVTGKVK